MKLDYIYQGDALEVLRTLPDQSVNCCVTSPPYWGLRDYGVQCQLGLERTPEEYVAKMTAVFHEVWRVLRDDGTLWLNLGDSYAATTRSAGASLSSTLATKPTAAKTTALREHGSWSTELGSGLKAKDLVGIPWRVAFALQSDGWWLRSDIIWSKPNPMPESVTDRPTRSHEYVFLLAKSQKYYYDAEAVKEQSLTNDPRRPYGSKGAWEIDKRPNEQKHGGECRAPANRKRGEFNGKTNVMPGREAFRKFTEIRNLRSVWTVTTTPFAGVHFATFPRKLIEPMILAGCPLGGIVLDPFIGSGTTGLIALQHGRHFVGIELNPKYVEMANERIWGPLINSVKEIQR